MLECPCSMLVHGTFPEPCPRSSNARVCTAMAVLQCPCSRALARVRRLCQNPFVPSRCATATQIVLMAARTRSAVPPLPRPQQLLNRSPFALRLRSVPLRCSLSATHGSAAQCSAAQCPAAQCSAAQCSAAHSMESLEALALLIDQHWLARLPAAKALVLGGIPPTAQAVKQRGVARP